MNKVVLGGGLGGLSAAYYLSKKLPRQAITLIESSSRTGGWVKSNVQKSGVVFEQGPRTIRPSGDAGLNTLQLVEDLKLTDKIIPIGSSHPAAQNRMIYANGRLNLLPNTPGRFFTKTTLFSKPMFFYIFNDLRAKKKEVHDEPIYDFVERRLGKEIADNLISPMICGICAGNAHEISVKFLMRKMFELEQEHGSLLGGAFKSAFSAQRKVKKPKRVLGDLAKRAKQEQWSIYSFNDGCETLPLALRDNLQNNVSFKLNTVCKSVSFDKNQAILKLSDNQTISTDHLVSAVPAATLGSLVQDQHPDLGTHLKNLVKNVSVAVVNLHFKENILKQEAFGLLVAPKENLPILGIIFDSCCFPEKSSGTALTVMMGGYWFEQHFGKNPTEQKLLDVAVSQVKQILEVQSDPETHKVNILHQCLPQYIVGHDDTLKKINDYIDAHKLPMSICGASYYGVGINDVILSAKNAVDKL